MSKPKQAKSGAKAARKKTPKSFNLMTAPDAMERLVLIEFFTLLDRKARGEPTGVFEPSPLGREALTMLYTLLEKPLPENIAQRLGIADQTPVERQVYIEEWRAELVHAAKEYAAKYGG